MTATPEPPAQPAPLFSPEARPWPYTTPSGHTYRVPQTFGDVEQRHADASQAFIESWDAPEHPPEPTWEMVGLALTHARRLAAALEAAEREAAETVADLAAELARVNNLLAEIKDMAAGHLAREPRPHVDGCCLLMPVAILDLLERGHPLSGTREREAADELSRLGQALGLPDEQINRSSVHEQKVKDSTEEEPDAKGDTGGMDFETALDTVRRDYREALDALGSESYPENPRD